MWWFINDFLTENELFAQFVLLSGLKIYFFWQKYTSQTKYFFGSLSNRSPWWTFPKRYPLCPWFSSLMPNSKVTKKLGKVIKLFLFHLQFTESDLETTLFISFQFSKTNFNVVFSTFCFIYFTSVICVKSWKFVSFDI